MLRRRTCRPARRHRPNLFRSHRIRFEPLEERQLLATVVFNHVQMDASTGSGTISGTIDASSVGGPTNLMVSAPTPAATINQKDSTSTNIPAGTVGYATGSSNANPGAPVGVHVGWSGMVTLTGTDGSDNYEIDVPLTIPSGTSFTYRFDYTDDNGTGNDVTSNKNFAGWIGNDGSGHRHTASGVSFSSGPDTNTRSVSTGIGGNGVGDNVGITVGSRDSLSGQTVFITEVELTIDLEADDSSLRKIVSGEGVVVSTAAINTHEGVSTATYDINLNTVPAGPVEITVTADAQSEVSVNGTDFFSAVAFSKSDDSLQTITVRPVDDTVDEGEHTSTISHAITATDDPSGYPTSMSISDVTNTIRDNDGLTYALLDFGTANQRVEPAGFAVFAGSGGNTNGTNVTNLPFVSNSGDDFEVSVTPVDTSGSSTGNIDWRDRGDSSNGAQALVQLGEDLVKNNSGIIRVTLSSLPAGSYNAVSFHMDPGFDQSDFIQVLVSTDGGATFANTGVSGDGSLGIAVNSLST